MKSTFKLMGIADFITIFNGLLGTCAILFLLLAVEDMSQPYFEGGVKVNYIWAAMMCIFLSAIGDIIDGPIARRYSKQQLLGGSLDIMSDCISFCVAPALMVFTMFSRWGEASPIWTIFLAIACCWMIACGMLRLARFQHDEGGYIPYFHGLSSPANALLIISVAGLIWLIYFYFQFLGLRSLDNNSIDNIPDEFIDVDQSAKTQFLDLIELTFSTIKDINIEFEIGIYFIDASSNDYILKDSTSKDFSDKLKKDSLISSIL